MRELYTFRITEAAANEALGVSDGDDAKGFVRVIETARDEPLFERIGSIDRAWRREGRSFLLGWEIRREYTDDELDAAEFFRLVVIPVFEPTGVECETVYDTSAACSICGLGRRLVSPLRVDPRKIPKGKDFAETIAGEEWVVSRRFVEIIGAENLTGVGFDLVEHCRRPGTSVEGWSQLVPTGDHVDISERTLAGISPFDFDDAGEYRCPRGHVIGLNLIGELMIDRAGLGAHDLTLTRQAVGVTRGALVPRRQILISRRAWRVLSRNQLRGWRVEIARIV